MRGAARTTHVAMALALACCILVGRDRAALAQEPGVTEMVSRGAGGAAANSGSGSPSVSADGRYAAYDSAASNLVDGDTNGVSDVFVYDRQSGATTRVSLSSTGAQGNGSSTAPAISPDGRYVAFTSLATNLAPDFDGLADLYLHDRQTGRTVLVAAHTHGAPLPSAYAHAGKASFAADGQYLAFVDTIADEGATSGYRSVVCLYDVSGGIRVLDLTRPDGRPVQYVYGPVALSADGRYVAFQSVDYLEAGDNNNTFDVFLHDCLMGTTRYVSVSNAGAYGNAESRSPVVSQSGRYVAFDSLASNLVPGDTNASYDVFVRDTWLGTTSRVSVSGGGEQATYSSRAPAISADGRHVAFESDATNLVPGDTNYSKDVFLRDCWYGTTARLSLADDEAQANAFSGSPSLSASGLHVAFYSTATNLVAGGSRDANVFLRVRAAERFPPPPSGPSLTLAVPVEPVVPDGVTEHEVTATVLDASGRPAAGATVSFTLVPGIGDLSASTAATGTDGRATVRYRPPKLTDLGDDTQVTIVAWSANLGDTGVIEFKPPDVFREATPRYYQSGWHEWHALVPPDATVPAVIRARLTYLGKPVRDYPVTLTVGAKDGAYDGDFAPHPDALSQESHRLSLLTDADGQVSVAYLTTTQASRGDAVVDEVTMSGRPFGYMASWLVETGIDLEIVDVHPTGAGHGEYVVLGEPEGLEIEVRDRLHPSFLLANYNDYPGPIIDPDNDYLLGARLEISHEASTEEFLRLIEVPYRRVPRMATFHTFFYAASGRTFLHTSVPGNLDGRPWITPWIKGASMYWLEVHLETGIAHQLVRDSGAPLPDMEESGNNYRILAVFTNELLDTWVEFIRGNPCGANSHFTRTVKCWVSLLSMVPGADVYFGPASTALDICETVFNIINGQWASAAATASTSQLGEFADWLENSRPDLLSRHNLSLRGWGSMKRLDRIINVMDCYWALRGMKDELQPASVCAAQSPAAADDSQREREADLVVMSLLNHEGRVTDALVVAGGTSVQLRNAGGQTVPLVTDGAAFDEGSGYFSISSGGVATYMIPRGSYTLTLTTSANTYVYLYRRESSLAASTRLYWEDKGTASRRCTIAIGASGLPTMSVDIGANGSVDRSVAPTSARYLANPTSLQATEVDGDTVRLTWPAVPGASSYRVLFGEESRYLPLFDGYADLLSSTGTVIEVSGLSLPGVVCYFTVTAVDSGGNESLYGPEAMAGDAVRVRPVLLPVVLRGQRY